MFTLYQEKKREIKMKILEKENARRYIRKGGIKSYLLSSALISDSELHTTTLVEIEIDGI